MAFRIGISMATSDSPASTLAVPILAARSATPWARTAQDVDVAGPGARPVDGGRAFGRGGPGIGSVYRHSDADDRCRAGAHSAASAVRDGIAALTTASDLRHVCLAS